MLTHELSTYCLVSQVIVSQSDLLELKSLLRIAVLSALTVYILPSSTQALLIILFLVHVFVSQPVFFILDSHVKIVVLSSLILLIVGSINWATLFLALKKLP